MKLLLSFGLLLLARGAGALGINPDCDDWTFYQYGDHRIEFRCPDGRKWLTIDDCPTIKKTRNSVTLKVTITCGEVVFVILPRKV